MIKQLPIEQSAVEQPPIQQSSIQQSLIEQSPVDSENPAQSFKNHPRDAVLQTREHRDPTRNTRSYHSCTGKY